VGMGTRPRVLSILAVISLLTLTLATTASAAGMRFRAELTGAQEVPPADPDARGDAEITLKPSEGQICFAVEFRRVGTPNRGHIHVGPAGVNGGVAVTLFELEAAPATDPRFDELERGRLRGCVDADAAIIDAIAADPAGYYVNLHNGRFPGGAIRGQLPG
jgi:hypothetical protein